MLVLTVLGSSFYIVGFFNLCKSKKTHTLYKCNILQETEKNTNKKNKNNFTYFLMLKLCVFVNGNE